LIFDIDIIFSISCLNKADLDVECRSSTDDVGVNVNVCLPLIKEFRLVKVFSNLSYYNIMCKAPP